MTIDVPWVCMYAIYVMAIYIVSHVCYMFISTWALSCSFKEDRQCEGLAAWDEQQIMIPRLFLYYGSWRDQQGEYRSVRNVF